MFFHVVLTTECNLQCRYCFGEALEDFDEDFAGLNVDYALPKKADYDFALLAKLCRRDPDCVLTFYGGEPLLCIDEIRQIMDTVKPRHFLIQTNGLLLDRLPAEYVNRFHTILVSVDGDEALTDYYRGKGTFRKVINNMKLITRNGFSGELIARMTVMEQTDIYKQVRWLLENKEFTFSSVHWQLNAGFWGNDYQRRDFKHWSETSYVPGIERLARFWVDQMQTRGTVQKLYPFLGIANSLLNGERNSQLRCGGGWINYAIQTDGKIIPCPTMWGMKDYYLGHIKDTNPLELRKLSVTEPCSGCDIMGVCGGRCLYANVTNRWSRDAYAQVCSTVRRLVKAVEAEVPRIKQLINDGKLRLSDFEFVKYNGCEIIP
ncbi:TIGR04084 family radical SAM/SPASM domain-containing protein [Candidatus Bathyarchaeota archaeon A05DMB-2]|jgi:putative peptide-modifying radical SAM enzyme|nr:TIGR04084 family radical SAM/SPASM domain-containing protein [Candidatus Bathyarchaeota archaeon A05DMB-2]